ncbi:glycosyltransferase family 2 protein, partial [bacterium]|nr:glycosyltransferase family 2 protein [bacterium]
MANPKISVIVPVYNVEKYLPECLDSIVNQTLKEIEIICVNDGSTDNSLSILREYSSKDNRIKIIDKENEGLEYTRKVGLDNATGKYILFCDSDDKYFSNDVFEKLYNEIQKNNSELMFFRFLYGNKESVKVKFDINLKDNSQNIFNLYFAHWFKIYKKSFLDRYDSV